VPDPGLTVRLRAHGKTPARDTIIGDDWFLDADYDGMTFYICQAFFPGDGRAWKRLQRALKAQIDPEAFEQMRGTVSFSFEPGEHKRIAVKVIDFRGNEVVWVMALNGVKYEHSGR